MSWRVIKQPNGQYGVFSSVVDGFVVTNATTDEIRKLFTDQAKDRAIDNADRALSMADSGKFVPSNLGPQSWEEAVEEHNERHPDDPIELQKPEEILRPPWNNQEDEDNDVCSWPDCANMAWDDGCPLTYVRVVLLEGEEGYGDVTQALCTEHLQIVTEGLVELGFVSHNHHGTQMLGNDEVCGGYGKCKTPKEYGPELVQ